jgi:hypothetical protein
MFTRPSRSLVGVCVALIFLAGCVATGTDSPTTSAPPSSSLTFLDMKGFDSDLYRALDAKLPEVTVSFLDKPSPNKTPERVQKWLESLKQSGGQLEIVQPPNELAPKNPLALIGLLGSAWSSGKALIEINDQRKLSAIKGRDAVIYLQRSKTGDIIIDRITLKAAN